MYRKKKCFRIRRQLQTKTRKHVIHKGQKSKSSQLCLNCHKSWLIACTRQILRHGHSNEWIKCHQYSAALSPLHPSFGASSLDLLLRNFLLLVATKLQNKKICLSTRPELMKRNRENFKNIAATWKGV